MLNISSLVVPANTWKHIAASVDCSNKKETSVTLFVDGKNVKEAKIVAPEREPLGMYFACLFSHHSFIFLSQQSYFELILRLLVIIIIIIIIIIIFFIIINV